MTEHGIYPEWDFKFDRSRTRHGQAREATVRGRKVKEISLSKHLVDLCPKERVKDTILHEIAHVLVGLEHGHDKVWETKALAIGSTAKQFADEDIEMVAHLSKYHYVCLENYHAVRFSNRVLDINKFVCTEHPEAEIRMVEVPLSVA